MRRLFPRALFLTLASIGVMVFMILLVGLKTGQEKHIYELVKDLLVPLIGPMVAVLIPLLIFVVLPLGQSREKFALDLCNQYYTEEMRESRNTGWEHFVTSQRKLPPVRRAERLNHFMEYLTNPEAHRSIDPEQDRIYQKATRVMDFFALVNVCLARGTADPEIVRSFLLYYYLWWRDEIMDPLRKTRRITGNAAKFTPLWWANMTYIDRLE